MDAWHMKRLRVRLKTPLKCGDRPFGFIARTLPFIPSHVPLMAIVPAAAGLLGLPDLPESYYRIQEFLEKNMRFSPFFILDPKDDSPLFPFRNTAGLDRIESLFLNARHGVAIDYSIRGAIDARLFEVESINPVGRDGNNTMLEGYIFWREATGEDGLELDETCNLNRLGINRLIDKSQWGGERNKGYGNVASTPGGEESKQSKKIWGEALTLSGDTPCIEWPARKKAPFYLSYHPELNKKVSGRLQPLVGRIFVPGRGAGQGASEHLIVWDLGWSADVALRIEMGVKALHPVTKK